MTTTDAYTEPKPELQRRTLPSGEARVAVMTRTYPTSVEDLWDACTNPERLARWYTIVTGDLVLGGTFHQELMGSGAISECDAPHHLRLTLGNEGQDEILVTISEGSEPGTAQLEVQHATTFDTHEIGGQMYDAIYCMGGGYYPRLRALDLHLRGELPDDYVVTKFFENPDMRETINRGMADMQELLDADAAS
jgi:uncharacterized protein YndB with AHSA1/START domain